MAEPKYTAELCGQPECDCCRFADKRIAELEAALREASGAIQILRTAIDSGDDAFVAMIATAPVQAKVEAVLTKSTS